MSVLPITAATIMVGGEMIVMISGKTAPILKLAAEASAACVGLAVVISEIPNSSWACAANVLAIFHSRCIFQWCLYMEKMSTPTDKYAALAALFRSGLDGNQADYAGFLASITPLLKRMVGKRLNAAEVDDVVQEILISIHKARHTYDGLRPIMPWIASIARFRVTDHLRKHYTSRRDKTVDISDLENILVDVTEEASDRESIDELLQDVPEQHKRILTLMHVEGYTAKEVGAQMNMNESAVKVAAHRAIKKIRKKFVA